MSSGIQMGGFKESAIDELVARAKTNVAAIDAGHTPDVYVTRLSHDVKAMTEWFDAHPLDTTKMGLPRIIVNYTHYLATSLQHFRDALAIYKKLSSSDFVAHVQLDHDLVEGHYEIQDAALDGIAAILQNPAFMKSSNSLYSIDPKERATLYQIVGRKAKDGLLEEVLGSNGLLGLVDLKEARESFSVASKKAPSEKVIAIVQAEMKKAGGSELTGRAAKLLGAIAQRQAALTKFVFSSDQRLKIYGFIAKYTKSQEMRMHALGRMVATLDAEWRLPKRKPETSDKSEKEFRNPHVLFYQTYEFILRKVEDVVPADDVVANLRKAAKEGMLLVVEQACDEARERLTLADPDYPKIKKFREDFPANGGVGVSDDKPPVKRPNTVVVERYNRWVKAVDGRVEVAVGQFKTEFIAKLNAQRFTTGYSALTGANAYAAVEIVRAPRPWETPKYSGVDVHADAPTIALSI